MQMHVSIGHQTQQPKTEHQFGFLLSVLLSLLGLIDKPLKLLIEFVEIAFKVTQILAK